MSKYTTEIRFICEEASGLIASQGYNSLDNILNQAIPKIFDFSYPIFDESYRKILEKKILKHFYTREICEETVGLWKLRLDSKLNEIMPYYNKLYNSELIEFNPLYNVSLNRVHNSDILNNKVENEAINENSKNNNTSDIHKNSMNNTENNTNTNNTVISNSNGLNTNKNNIIAKDLYSDTPQGSLTNIENETYLTNARKNINDEISNNISSTNTNDNSTETSKENSNTVILGDEKVVNDSNNELNRNRSVIDSLNTTENYLEKIVGYQSVNPNKMLEDYRNNFLNIDIMILNDLEVLFMQLW